MSSFFCGMRQAMSTCSQLIQKRAISKSILIKGLPSNITRAQMDERFTAFGRIADVRFIPHAAKYKTCSGVITFEHIHSALQVVDELQHALVFGRRVQIEFNRFNTTRQYAPSTHCKEFKELEKEKTRREIENFQALEREVQRNNGKSLHR